MSTRAILANICPHGFAVPAGIRWYCPVYERVRGRYFIYCIHLRTFLQLSGQYTVYCPLSQLKLTERACTQKYRPLRLAAHSWDPRQRSRDMQEIQVQQTNVATHIMYCHSHQINVSYVYDTCIVFIFTNNNLL